MTKAEVDKIIKYYMHVKEAIELCLSLATFEIGKRKKVIAITEQVKKVCEIIDMVYKSEEDEKLKSMIKHILDGVKDLYIMQNVVHYEKNAYYTRKSAFRGKVYSCCAACGLATFEEVLKEKIG